MSEESYAFHGEVQCNLYLTATAVAWDGICVEISASAWDRGKTPVDANAAAFHRAMTSLLFNARQLYQRPVGSDDEPLYWAGDGLPDGFNGALIDGDDELWVQLVSDPRNETYWLRGKTTNLETRNWSELRFPVRQAPDGWDGGDG